MSSVLCRLGVWEGSWGPEPELLLEEEAEGARWQGRGHAVGGVTQDVPGMLGFPEGGLHVRPGEQKMGWEQCGRAGPQLI